MVTDGSKETLPLGMKGEAVESWLEAITARSDFQADFAPSPDGRFMALCTCTYDYADARYVVYGQLEEMGWKEEGDQDEKPDRETAGAQEKRPGQKETDGGIRVMENRKRSEDGRSEAVTPVLRLGWRLRQSWQRRPCLAAAAGG